MIIYKSVILIIKTNMKTTINGLYRLFLMPYLERDRYFKELCDETEKECDMIALKILLKQEHKK